MNNVSLDNPRQEVEEAIDAGDLRTLLLLNGQCCGRTMKPILHKSETLKKYLDHYRTSYAEKGVKVKDLGSMCSGPIRDNIDNPFERCIDCPRNYFFCTMCQYISTCRKNGIEIAKEIKTVGERLGIGKTKETEG